MGYNNNFAGMHFMRYKQYAQYEDLAYYDKLAEEKRKQEKEKEVALKEEKKAEKATKNKKEKFISDEQMEISFDIYANIFIIAFDRKIDIYQSIKECEFLCEKDEIVGQTHAFALNPLEKSVVFLGLLAEKMNCKITDFFALNLEDRKKIAYRILKDELEKTRGRTRLIKMFY